jgi:hypothetical protein
MDDGTVEVREDRAIRTDSNGLSESQTYTYEPNPNGERHWFRRRKNGIWEEVELNHETNRYRKTNHGSEVRLTGILGAFCVDGGVMIPSAL